MPNSLPKIIASILLGMAFLFGGAVVVSAADAGGDAVLKGLNCGIGEVAGVNIGSGTLTDCVPVFVYYLFYKPASFILVGGAYVFDAMLMLSIDSKFVQQDFIDTSWKVVRDFSNMAFIFVLLYTGIATMLGTHGWAKTVRNVVIIALLINFSLFFTKIIIDAGNILAVGIYESMGQPKPSTGLNGTHIVAGKSSLEERDISARLAKAFQPQSFIRTTEKIPALDAIIVFIISGVVSIFAGYIFFKAALLFIGRLLAFWFLMIISPFAFISITFPKGNKFQGWLDALVSQAFVAPVFLFLVYLIMQVINSQILDGLIENPVDASLKSFTFDKVLMPVIIATLVIMALKFALEFSEKMAGDFGKLGASMAGAAMGIAGGLALGGTALAGRAVGGKLAAKAFEGGTMQKWAASEKTGLLGAAQRNLGMRGTMALDTARSASWDARNVGLLSKGIKATGVDVGKAGGKGGYVQGEKDWVKEQKKKAALMELTSDEKKSIKEEAEGKAEIAGEKTVRAKLMVADAKEKHENSDGARLVATRTKQLDDEMSKLEEAKKNTSASQLAFDSAKNIGRIDPALKAARDAAEKAEEDTMNRMKEAETDLVKATADHSNSATASVLKTATESLTAAQQDEAKAIDALKNVGKKIKEEDERRRGAYAEQITPEITPVAGQVAGGVGGFMAAGPVGMAAGGVVGAALGAKFGPKVVSEERAKKIAAIRAGKSDEDKKKEDETALLKDIAKKIKEAEGGDH